ncbi:winged helix-turn-helix transcriptional regulator [Lentzea tibetensis]|uniref:Winged helix-turn-helix transcriptional regulator n=1 Tax=Lentzea tibetensis TaxID=2591470 RepID=A0A563F3L1_9PSEU|nr:metalloregulator ArsR/SmtB family transcription factor [Lentzea tibetensis]TWP54361.1 winged helix-turn-helix transcriptional regulator [Lentzea tibetensis]
MVNLSLTFGALSDPTRRSLVASLAGAPHTIADLAAPLPMSLVAVSKHVSVLERAGLLSRRRVGRAQLCTFTPEPMASASAWLSRYESFWNARADSLEQFLAEEER